ncbi:MAG: RNA polymerase sigma factor [Planctomycetota bacterium]
MVDPAQPPEPDPADWRSPDPDRTFVARYECIAPALCAWSMRHIGQTVRARVEVDDVMQETWLRAYGKRGDFRGDERAFRAWIFAIAKIVLLEVVRSVRRLHRVQINDGATSLLLALDGVHESVTRLTQRLVRDETIARFLDRLARLPPEDQDLISFCGLEGATCADAARKLGISTDAAVKRWQRLRARLGEEGLGHDWVA